ncbi:MAG: GAF domain-containing protein [Paracoccaceae bacterium]
MIDMTQAIETCEGQPEVTFRALEKLTQDRIGAKLFTLMEIDREKRVARRSYSNMPVAYPVSGEKPMMQNAWSEIIEGRHEIFVANSIEEIAEVFDDYELIQSLGCESCLNLPIVIRGELWGTLNCLDVAGHYTKERIATAETLKPAGALAFLLADAICKGGNKNG